MGYETSWVFCAGMRRAASSWQFKTVCDFLPDAYHLGFIAHTEFPYYFGKLREDVVIVKSHAFLPDYSRRVFDFIPKDKITIVMSMRDIRDSCASLNKKWVDWGHKRDDDSLKETVKAIINETNSWKRFGEGLGNRVLVQRYEDIVSDYKQSTGEIKQVLLNSGLNPDGNVDDVYQFNLPEKMKRIHYSRADSGRIWWHKDHIIDGVVGKWESELSKDQIDIIESNGGKEWMEMNNYA